MALPAVALGAALRAAVLRGGARLAPKALGAAKGAGKMGKGIAAWTLGEEVFSRGVDKALGPGSRIGKAIADRAARRHLGKRGLAETRRLAGRTARRLKGGRSRAALARLAGRKEGSLPAYVRRPTRKELRQVNPDGTSRRRWTFGKYDWRE